MFAFVAIVAVIGPVILGAMAFLRTTRYAKIIMALDERVRSLEGALKDGVVVREERVIIREEVRPVLETPAPQIAPPPAEPDLVIIANDPLPTPKGDAQKAAPDSPSPASPSPEAARTAFSQAASAEAAPADAKQAKEEAGFGWVYALLGGAVAAAAVIGIGMAAGSGALGPAAQSLGGLLLAAALVYGATAFPRLPDGGLDGRALLLGGVGLFCGLASALGGHFLVGAWSAQAGLAAWTAAALAGAGLSLVFGAGFAWVGLAAALLGPLVFRVPVEQAASAAAALAATVAVGLAVARLAGWRWMAWAMLTAALAWGGGMAAVFGVGGAAATAAYLVGVCVIAAALAWDAAAGPALLLGPDARQPAPDRRDAVLGWPEPLAVGHALALGALALLCTHFFITGEKAAPAGIALAGLAAVAILITVFREGLNLIALASAGIAMVTVAFWPRDMGPALDLNIAAAAALVLGLFSTLGGWAMMLRHTAPTTGAVIASLGPMGALLAARVRLGDFGMPWAYGLAALALAAAMAFAFWKLREANPKDTRFGPSSAFALGSALSAAMAIGVGLPGLWLAAGLAALAPLGALADKRFNLAGARAAVAAIGAVVVYLLTIGLTPVTGPISSTPIANELVIAYVIAVVALYSAAAIIGRSRGEGWLAEGLRFGCIAMTVAFAAYTVRHLVHGGVMAAPYQSAVELGLHTAIVIAAAALLVVRYGAAPGRPMLRAADAVLTALGVLAAVGLILVINPAWGMWARPAATGLELAYGAPTVALAAYALVSLRGVRPGRTALAACTASALGFVWLTLTIRAAADGVDLAGRGVSPAAHWGLSLGWIAYAAALGLISVLAAAPGLKQASAGLFIAALVKVLVIDLNGLDPVMRVFASLLLGALAVGSAMVYQRWVFGRAPILGQNGQSARRRTDPNLMPPRG